MRDSGIKRAVATPPLTSDGQVGKSGVWLQ